MKIRKLILCLGIFLEYSYAHANLFFASPGGPFAGWYGGISVGTTAIQADENVQVPTRFDFEAIVIPSIIQTSFNTSYSAKEYSNTLMDNLNLGYGFNFGCISPNLLFHVALEAFRNVNYNNSLESNLTALYTEADSLLLPPSEVTEGTIANIFAKSKIDFRTQEFGIDFKPGIVFSGDTLLYGRIGVAFNDIDFNSDNNAILNFFPNTFVGLPILNKDRLSVLRFGKNETLGLRLGGGIESYFTPHLSIHGDYIYTNYGKFNATGIGDTQGFGDSIVDSAVFLPLSIVPNGYVNHSKIDISTQTFLVGLNYYIAPYLGPFGSEISGPAAFGGAYVGLRGGLLHLQGTDFDSRTEVNTFAFFGAGPSGGSINQIQSHPADVYDNKGTGALFLGYGRFLGSSPFYLGAEEYLNPFSNDIHVNQISQASYHTVVGEQDVNTSLITNSKISTSGEIGADFRPGFLIDCSTLLYGRVGLGYTQTTLSSSSTFKLDNRLNLLAIEFATSTSSLRASDSENKLGLRLGGGLEAYMGRNVSLSVDYIYTDYGHLSDNAVGPTTGFLIDPVIGFITVGIPNGIIKHDKVNISSQQVTAGITYHFC